MPEPELHREPQHDVVLHGAMALHCLDLAAAPDLGLSQAETERAEATLAKLSRSQLQRLAMLADRLSIMALAAASADGPDGVPAPVVQAAARAVPEGAPRSFVSPPGWPPAGQFDGFVLKPASPVPAPAEHDAMMRQFLVNRSDRPSSPMRGAFRAPLVSFGDEDLMSDLGGGE